MAAPMVTGIVALLKSIHPDWSAERIKSAIINTAKDIGLSAYKQGGGRVQALKAASRSSWIVPATLNLGLDDPAVSSWSRTDTFFVHNAMDVPQDYTTSFPDVQSGISISSSPSGFTIPAEGVQQLIVTTSVNNTAVPIVADDIPLYSGRMMIYGSVDSLAVPWAFARATRLTISFNEPSPYFLGTNVEPPIYGSGPDINWKTPTQAEVFGYKKGTYDFYALFPSPVRSKIVYKENVLLNDDAQVLTISSTEATLPLSFQGKDQDGKPISSYPSSRKVVVTGIPNWGDQVASFEQSSDSVMISPASARYSFRPIEYQFNPLAAKSFHIAQYPTFTGIAAGKTLTNSTADYVHQNFRFQFPPNTPHAILVGELFSYRENGGLGFMSGIGFDFDSLSVIGDEFTFKGYFLRSSEPLNDVAVKFYSLNGWSADFFDIETYPVMRYNDSIIAITRDNAMITVPRSPNGGTMSFGDAPVFLTTLWYNNVFGAGSTMHFATLFRGVHRETRYGDLYNGTYSIYNQDGNLVFTNPLDDFPRGPKELSADWYTMEITSSNYWLRNKKGTVRQTAEFDLLKKPANPPSIISFAVLNQEGLPTNSFVKGGSGTLMFSSEVINFISSEQVIPESTQVWYRVHGSSVWNSLPVQLTAIVPEKDGSVFKADLGPALSIDSIAIDLRVFVKSAAGFTNDFQITPAFAVGNWTSNDPNDVKDDPQSTIPKEFTLHQNFPNPFNPSTTIRFGIPRQSSVQVEIFDILGRRIEVLTNGTLAAGFHDVRWDAGVPSGVYLYRVTARPADGNSGTFVQTRKMMMLR